MAQREKEETEVQVTESLTLCANNCGFYGNPTTKNLCQSCFQSQIRSPALGSAQKKPRSDPISPPETDSPPPPLPATAEDRTKTAPPPKLTNRCSSCRKRVGLTGFRCRCGELFCGSHRYSDRHACSYDYKAAGREEIRRENPVVRAAKIVRI